MEILELQKTFIFQHVMISASGFTVSYRDSAVIDVAENLVVDFLCQITINKSLGQIGVIILLFLSFRVLIYRR